MGRCKIEIKKIDDREARQVCFSKRRAGPFKKASELCILCGAEVAVIVFSLASKAYTFGHPCVDSVLDCFTHHQTGGPIEPTPGPNGPTHGLSSCGYQLEQYLNALLELKAKVDMRATELMCGQLRGGAHGFAWVPPPQALKNYGGQEYFFKLM
ncbi:hypothetical protein AMTRI_Chr13g115690 [Amborella trichopoda]